MNATWTAEREQFLRDRWAAGDSASLIARALNCGVTRSALLGKVHRLGLLPRQTTTQVASSRWMHHKRKIAKQPRPKPNWDIRRPSTTTDPTPIREIAPPTDAVPVTLMARTAHQCGWILGETNGPNTLMCGAPKDIEAPYCAYHTNVATGFSRPAWTDERRQKTLVAKRRVAA